MTASTRLTQLNNLVKIAGTLRLKNRTTVASAATIDATAAANTGNYWSVTGTTTITAITTDTNNNGRTIVLEFASAACQVTDNGTTLDLSENYISTAGGTLTLICDGTNWHEVCRSTLLLGTTQAVSMAGGASQTVTLTDAFVQMLIVTHSGGGAPANIVTINPSTTTARRLVLKCTSSAGADTVGATDGSNLKLNGNYTVSASTTGSLELICDGTNWIELTRITSGLQ
jgi:hypothetical protein